MSAETLNPISKIYKALNCPNAPNPLTSLKAPPSKREAKTALREALKKKKAVDRFFVIVG